MIGKEEEAEWSKMLIKNESLWPSFMRCYQATSDPYFFNESRDIFRQKKYEYRKSKLSSAS
ncbi:hypothetical protein C7401_13740 [Paraburkholderia unamae]|nr:hypothetical protein C7401_13740 [Paraburkholderia unamae]